MRGVQPAVLAVVERRRVTPPERSIDANVGRDNLRAFHQLRASELDGDSMFGQHLSGCPPVRIRRVYDDWLRVGRNCDRNELSIRGIERRQPRIVRELEKASGVLMNWRDRDTSAMRFVSLVVPEPLEKCVPRPWLAPMGEVSLVLLQDEATVIDENDILSLSCDQPVDASFHTRSACLSR